MPDRLTLFACWEKARKEFPDDREKRAGRYVELLREQGHVVKREPGDRRPLFPCGYKPKAQQSDGGRDADR